MAQGRLNKPVYETLHTLNRKLQGHCNYYEVNGKFKFIAKFYRYAQYRIDWMLRRRSQRCKLTWENWNWDVGAEFRISIKTPELQGLLP